MKESEMEGLLKVLDEYNEDRNRCIKKFVTTVLFEATTPKHKLHKDLSDMGNQNKRLYKDKFGYNGDMYGYVSKFNCLGTLNYEEKDKLTRDLQRELKDITGNNVGVSINIHGKNVGSVLFNI